MNPHRYRLAQAWSPSHPHGPRRSRLALRLLFSLSIVALTGCSDREAPTAVARDPQGPTLDVVGADYLVTTTADAGPGSLRQAILDANAAGVAKTIGFAIPSSDAGCATPNVCTISLAASLPAITNSAGLTIDGTGQSIALSGRDAVRVLDVGLGAVATIKRLMISGGFTSSPCGDHEASGGGICSVGTLTVIESSLYGNHAHGGAAIMAEGGALTVIGTTFRGNSGDGGSAIFTITGTINITNSTFTNNPTPTAAVVASLSAGSITNSTFSGGVEGGAILVNVGTIRVRNTILAVGAPLACQVTNSLDSFIADEGGNVSAGDGTCPGVLADPKLGPLQINAPGLTATHALLEGSAAIGAALAANCPATDQRGVSRGSVCDAGAYQSSVPSDETAPVIASHIDGTLGSDGWYTSDVTVNWSVTDEESAITSAPCAPTTISSDTPGQVVSCSATSDGGTSTQTVTVKRDGTAPTLAPIVSPNPVLLNGTATASPNAADGLSGLASSSCGTPVASTAGSKAVNCTATDRAGNTRTVAANYVVIYNFTGFLQPVDPMPTVNVVKAGSAVQVKFGLGGNQGLAIFAAGFPASQQVSCDASAPQDDVEATVTAGNSSLSYDASTQQYGYTWKTDKTWAGTCRMLTVKLADGMTYQASFKFK